MAADNRAIKRDVDNQPIPQVYDDAVDEFQPALGTNGRQHAILYAPDGTPVTPASAAAIDALRAEIAALRAAAASEATLAGVGSEATLAALSAKVDVLAAENAAIRAAVEGQAKGTDADPGTMKLSGSKAEGEGVGAPAVFEAPDGTQGLAVVVMGYPGPLEVKRTPSQTTAGFVKDLEVAPAATVNVWPWIDCDGYGTLNLSGLTSGQAAQNFALRVLWDYTGAGHTENTEEQYGFGTGYIGPDGVERGADNRFGLTVQVKAPKCRVQLINSGASARTWRLGYQLRP